MLRSSLRWSALVIVMSAVLAGSVDAQPSAPDATTVLAKVQQFYAKASHLTALFRQVVTNATFNTAKTSTGKLWVAKPSQFRWDYLERARGSVMLSKTFIFDGKTLWLVDHQNKQIFQNKMQGGVLPAAVSFLTGGTRLSEDFNVGLDTSGKYGSTVLELTPKQPSAQYKQLFFVVEARDWHISESIVIDSNGDTNAFSFYSPDLGAPVKASWFKVNPASIPSYKLVVVGGGGTSGYRRTIGNSTPSTPSP